MARRTAGGGQALGHRLRQQVGSWVEGLGKAAGRSVLCTQDDWRQGNHTAAVATKQGCCWAALETAAVPSGHSGSTYRVYPAIINAAQARQRTLTALGCSTSHKCWGPDSFTDAAACSIGLAARGRQVVGSPS
jgi:hypothetical protein